jgi:hypothetical protein
MQSRTYQKPSRAALLDELVAATGQTVAAVKALCLAVAELYRTT